MKKQKNHWLKLKKAQILKFITVLTIIALTATTLFISAAGTVVLYVSPATKSVTVNDTFTTSIRVNAQSETVGYVKAYLNFPSDKLSVVSISASGSGFGSQIEQTFNNSNGTIQIQRSGTRLSGDRLVANLTFKAKTVGTATVAFSNASDVKGSSGSGGSKLTSTSSGSYKIAASLSPIPPPTPVPSPTPLPSAPAPSTSGPIASNPPSTTAAGSPSPTALPNTEPEPIISTTLEETLPEQSEAVSEEVPGIQSTANVLADSDNKKMTIGLVAIVIGIMALVMVALLRRRIISNRMLAAHTANLTKSASPTQTTGPVSIGPVVMPGSYAPTEIATPGSQSLPDPPEAHEPPPPPPVELKEIDPLKPDGQPKDMFEMAEERFEQDSRMEEFREDEPPKPQPRR